MVTNLTYYGLNQVTAIIIIGNATNEHHTPPDRTRELTHTCSALLLPKMHNLNPVEREHHNSFRPPELGEGPFLQL